MSINIALDGPSGAGKSTIAKAVSQKLGYIYVDTGAMYRTVAYHVLSNNIEINDKEKIINEFDNIHVSLKHIDGAQHIFLNDIDVSDKIRTPEISMGASNVSAIPEVRQFLFDLQKNIAKTQNIIMDGRDIGTVVLPDAQIKIFLTASAEERAKRRYQELIEKGQDVIYDDVLKDINQRDYNDTHREIAPLKQAKDAIVLDTSTNSLEESINLLYQTIQKRINKIESKNKNKINPIRIFFYFILRQIITLLYHLYYDLRVEGKDNIPSDGGYVFASNHRSYADPILLSFPTRVPFAYMAKEELFKNKAMAILIRAFGAFPVTRGTGDMSVISEAIKRLNKGYNLVIFPEGTRSKDGKVGKGKTGVALIAAKAGVPVIPVGISFKGEKLKFRSKLIVKFGNQISPQQLNIESETPKELKKLKLTIMSAIEELVVQDEKKL